MKSKEPRQKARQPRQEPKTIHLKVHAFPGSRKEFVSIESADRLVIRVRERAEENRANDRILEIVRSMYPGRPVRLVKGHHSSNKIIQIS